MIGAVSANYVTHSKLPVFRSIFSPTYIDCAWGNVTDFHLEAYPFALSHT